jgi:uncharacterized protein (DUF302 family)
MPENQIVVKHEVIKLSGSYESFIVKLDTLVKKLDVKYAQNVAIEPKKTEEYLKSLEGDTGLIMFSVQNHGELLAMVGKRRKARQYEIGNPLVAIQMTTHDIRAALYAPLRMIVYENEKQQTFVEYDLPSSLFGQFGNAAVDEVARGLDNKLLNVITLSDSQSRYKM